MALGDANSGGDSSAGQDQLNQKNVQHIQANESQFAVILANGSVVMF